MLERLAPVFEAVAAAERDLRRRLPRRRDGPRHPARRARASTSTSPSRATRSPSRRRSPTRSAAACARTRSSARRSSSTARASASTSSRRAPSSTTPRPRCRRSSTRRSARTSSAATSRSTRWPSRSRATTTAGSSTPSAAARDLEARRDPRPAQPLVHRRSDADLPRDPLREPLRLPDGRAHAAARARDCIEMGLVGDLSSARLRDELVALLEEGEVEHSILRLAELGADKAIHPHLAADEEAVALLGAPAGAARAATSVEVPAWRLGLIALARQLPPDEVYGWLAAPEGAPPRRRADRRRRHGRAADRRAAARRDARAGRGRRACRSATPPTRRCSRSRSPICEPLHDVLPRPPRRPARDRPAATSPSSASVSRRAWGRSSRSSADES